MNGRPSDELAVPLRLHHLLLALAGRVDDSALSDARELIARSRVDEAAELIAGTLIAGRVPVLAAEQGVLASVLEQTRSDAGLAEYLSVAADGTVDAAHRFSGDDEPGRGVAEAVDRTLKVLPGVRSLHAVWRTTAAGSVPGSLPQRVVLVEVGADGSHPATAYRVWSALRQAGISAVVEVAGAGVEWTAYHRTALASAVTLWRAAAKPAPAAVPSAARRTPEQNEWPTQAEHPTPPKPEPPNPAPAPEPAHSHAPTRAQSQSAKTEERSAVEVVSEIHPRWWEATEEGDGTAPQPEAERTVIAHPVAPPEERSESTADLSAEEQARLRAALAADPAEGKQISEAQRAGEQADDQALDEPFEGAGPTSVPQLSERDRLLLAKLHEELAKREKASADQVRANGSDWANEHPRWSAG